MQSSGSDGGKLNFFSVCAAQRKGPQVENINLMGSSRLGLLACLLLLCSVVRAQVNPFLTGQNDVPAVRSYHTLRTARGCCMGLGGAGWPVVVKP